MHHRPAALGRHDQGFDRGLPLLEFLLGLGELLYVFGGLLEGDELAAEISSARRGARRLPVRRHALASIEATVFLGSPRLLIAPRMEIGFGTFRQKQGPCLLEICPGLVEGDGGSVLMFARVRSRIEAAAPLPWIGIVRVAVAHRDRARRARLRNRCASTTRGHQSICGG